jgi:dTDP-4-dehydrorhamnose 3,5-epimerase
MFKGGVAVDDRGKVSFVNEFDFNGVKRFYMVENHAKGFVRAWHAHKIEAKYVFVVSGAIKLGLVEDWENSDDVEEYILSADNPSVLYIPPNSANGFMTLTDDAKVIFYSTTSMEEAKGDDYRLPADKWDIWEVEKR